MIVPWSLIQLGKFASVVLFPGPSIKSPRKLKEAMLDMYNIYLVVLYIDPSIVKGV